MAKPKVEKTKIVSIMLAVLVSYWTWFYTFKRDARKFWIGLGIHAFSILLLVLMICLPSESGIVVLIAVLWIFISLPAAFIIWIWSIVDVSVKDKKFYEKY